MICLVTGSGSSNSSSSSSSSSSSGSSANGIKYSQPGSFTGGGTTTTTGTGSGQSATPQSNQNRYGNSGTPIGQSGTGSVNSSRNDGSANLQTLTNQPVSPPQTSYASSSQSGMMSTINNNLNPQPIASAVGGGVLYSNGSSQFSSGSSSGVSKSVIPVASAVGGGVLYSNGLSQTYSKNVPVESSRLSSFRDEVNSVESQQLSFSKFAEGTSSYLTFGGGNSSLSSRGYLGGFSQGLIQGTLETAGSLYFAPRKAILTVEALSISETRPNVKPELLRSLDVYKEQTEAQHSKSIIDDPGVAVELVGTVGILSGVRGGIVGVKTSNVLVGSFDESIVSGIKSDVVSGSVKGVVTRGDGANFLGANDVLFSRDYSYSRSVPVSESGLSLPINIEGKSVTTFGKKVSVESFSGSGVGIDSGGSMVDVTTVSTKQNVFKTQSITRDVISQDSAGFSGIREKILSTDVGGYSYQNQASFSGIQTDSGIVVSINRNLFPKIEVFNKEVSGVNTKGVVFSRRGQIGGVGTGGSFDSSLGSGGTGGISSVGNIGGSIEPVSIIPKLPISPVESIRGSIIDDISFGRQQLVSAGSGVSSNRPVFFGLQGGVSSPSPSVLFSPVGMSVGTVSSGSLFSPNIMSFGTPNVGSNTFSTPSPDVVPSVGSGSLTVADVGSIADIVPKDTTFSSTVPFVPPVLPPVLPPIIPFGFPSFAPPSGVSGGTGRSSKNKFQYQTSITALSLGLRGRGNVKGRGSKLALTPYDVRPMTDFNKYGSHKTKFGSHHSMKLLNHNKRSVL